MTTMEINRSQQANLKISISTIKSKFSEQKMSAITATDNLCSFVEQCLKKGVLSNWLTFIYI